MDLETWQRFAPFAEVLLNKKGSETTDADLKSVALAIAGDEADDVFPLLTQLRDSDPNALISKLLTSEYAKKLFGKLAKQKKDREKIVFIKCPHCKHLFEEELK